jgi:TIR domain
MGNIFISYSHQDSDYVNKLEEDLKEKGFEVWVDRQIRYGTQWSEEIEDHLDVCAAFIVVLSENSRKSRWVQNEVSYAQEIKKPIFPILLSGKPWLSLKSTQHVDVRDENEKSLPSEFYESLSAVITRNPDDGPPPPEVDESPLPVITSVPNDGPPPFRVKQSIQLLLKVIAVLILLALAARVIFPKNSTLALQWLRTPTLNMQIANEKSTWANPLKVMRVNATREITIIINPGGTRRVACSGWDVQPKAVEIVQEDGCRMTFYAITYQDTTVIVNVALDGRNWKKTLYFRPKR